MRLISKHLIPLVVLVAAARPAAAQRVELTPFVGGFIPTGSLGSVRVPNPLGGTVAVKGEMVAAAVFGARVSVRSKSRLGLEATYFSGSPGMRIVAGGLNQTFNAKVDGGSVKVTYQATSQETGTDLTVSAGMAGVNHGGTAFSINGSKLSIGGTLGGGLRIAMSPSVALRFDAEFLLYRFQAGPLLNATLQHDFVLSAGLALSLNH